MTARNIACFSGGADSTAMILAMMDRGERIDGLLVTPTGNELPEVWEHWERVALMLGRSMAGGQRSWAWGLADEERRQLVDQLLIRPKGPDLAHLIAHFDALPNFRQRWCTRMIKIQPAIAWAARNPDATLCVGLRADEEERTGIISTSVPCRFPLREYGFDRAQVLATNARHGVPAPRRTDCAVCYHQRLGEWYELWSEHPEEWEKGEAWETKTGRTFRSPKRDTWPVPMAGMRARFEAGDKPHRSLKMLARDRDQQACRVCSL